VHDVVLKPFDLNRAKGTYSDVERQVDPCDISLGEVSEDLVGEVEPGRRRSGELRKNG